MSKIYLAVLFLFAGSSVFCQQKETGKIFFANPGITDAGMIPVHNGDQVILQTNSIAAGKKRPVLASALKVLGLATIAYESKKIMEGSGKLAEQAKKPGWLLPLGVGITLSADKIARKNPAQLFIKYLVYDTDQKLVQDEDIKIDNRAAAKNDGNLASRTVPVDGYVQLLLVDKKGHAVAGDPGIFVSIASPDNSSVAEAGTPSVAIAAKKTGYSPKETVSITSDKPGPGKVPEMLAVPSKTITSAITVKKEWASVNRGQKINTQKAASPSKVTNPYNSKKNDIVPVARLIQPSQNTPAAPIRLPYRMPLFLLPRSGLEPEDEEPGEPILRTGLDEDEWGDWEWDWDDWGDEGGLEDEFQNIQPDDGGGGGGDGWDEGWDEAWDEGGDGDGEYDPGSGEVHLVVKDGDGNVIGDYYLCPGDTVELPDGTVLYMEYDGTVTQTTPTDLGEVVVVSHRDSTFNVVMSGIGLGADVNGATFSSIGIVASAENILRSVGRTFTIAGIVAGGLPAAINLIKAMFNGGEIRMRDVINLCLAILAVIVLAGGLGFLGEAIGLFIDLILSFGGTIWDIWQLLHP